MLQADTIIPDGPVTQSLNRYSYVFNNPLSYTDPSGHVPLGNNYNFRYTYPNGDYFEGELTPEQFQEAMESQVENGSVSLGVAGVENAAFSNESGSSSLPISSYGNDGNIKWVNF